MSNPTPKTSSSLLLTNVLLIIITGLLVVLVIQNGNNSGGGNWNSKVVINSQDQQQDEPGAPAPQQAMSMPDSMLFSAVKAFPAGCEGKKLLVECSSSAAMEVKKKILAAEHPGESPRAIFDFIVNTWGEKVLSDEALQIRHSRTQPKP